MMHEAKKLVMLLLLVTGGRGGDAAEIALKAIATPEAAVVTLGDVADIAGGTHEVADELRSVPLMPAPPPGTRQFVTLQQVRNLLVAARVSMAGHRLSGAPYVAVSGQTPAALQRRIAALSSAELQRVENDLRRAVHEHVSSLAGTKQPWEIDLGLEEGELQQLAEATVPFKIEGGRPPWVGRHDLTVVHESPGGVGRLSLEVQISLTEPLVAVARPTERGAVLTARDLVLQRPSEEAHPRAAADAFRRVDDVVGKVARRPLRQGQILSPSMVKDQILVRRGKSVKVVALSQGIRVTTFGRSRDSGAMGELVYVESAETGEMFAAQVSGLHEVQVLGRGAVVVPSNARR